MFGGGGNKFKSAKVDTLIGNSAEVEGDVIYKGGLHVDGRVKGNVLADDDSDSLLILSERGVIEGDGNENVLERRFGDSDPAIQAMSVNGSADQLVGFTDRIRDQHPKPDTQLRDALHLG